MSPSPTGSPAAEGIVRPPRRPVGWRAPGPPPAAAPGTAPRAGEDLCFLAGDWRILQRLDGHRWSLDDLVTAWLAAEVVADRPPSRFLDLGCGIGTVLMLLAWRFPLARGVGIEAQAVSVDLARRSLAWNGADSRCEVLLRDFRDPGLLLDPPTFDLVTGTPPYLTPGHATPPHRGQCGPCHFELRGGVEAYLECAASQLAAGGRVVLCAAAPQRTRVAAAARAAGFVVERAVDVVPRAGKGVLFGVYAFARPTETSRSTNGRATDAPEIDIAPAAQLIVRDSDGQWTAQFRTLRRVMGMPAEEPPSRIDRLTTPCREGE